ncbi:MAG: protein kinase [Verrucomicrobiales bacterium]|nr:protein kinase [Verrucomicrobiales bacterium]
MTTNSQPNRCPDCGDITSADRVGGLCARCVADGLFQDLEAPETTTSPPASLPWVEGEVIGTGGMGVVAAAWDPHLGREVAVKRLRADRESQNGARERFLIEAKIASRLEHPGIVPVYQGGFDGAGRPYYAMRRLRGISLGEVLRGLGNQDPDLAARFPLNRLLSIFLKICDAVAYAHSRSVIHRDLKPDNIMLGDFGEVFVMDWGLAKCLQEPESSDVPSLDQPASPDGPWSEVAHTSAQVIVGTVGFMAPELAEGRSREADFRTDVYSLGAILYQILTLRPPVRGTDSEVMLDRVRRGDIRPPSDFNPGSGEVVAGQTSLIHCPGNRVPAALSAVAMNALSIHPDSRYTHVLEMQADIAAWQSGAPTLAEAASWWRPIALWIRRRRSGLAVAVGITLIVLVSAGFLRSAIQELRSAAPAFYAASLRSLEDQRLTEALRDATYASALAPGDADFLTHKAHLLQTELRFDEASRDFREVLRLRPHDAQARSNLNLCVELAALTRRQAVSVEILERLRSALAAQARHHEALGLATRMATHATQRLDPWNTTLREAGLTGGIVRLADGSLELDLSRNRLSGAEVLQGLPIHHLKLRETTISNLSPLVGMPLRSLDLQSTKVRSLDPLKGSALERLSMDRSPVADLTPLVGMPLRHLSAAFTKVESLDALRDLPLESLGLQSTRVADLRPLTGMSLRTLSLWETKVTDLEPLRGMPLVALYFPFTTVSSLAPLEGMPLEVLDASWTQVADLAPLRRSPLTGYLSLNATRVSELRPLAGTKVQQLNLGRTRITDLGPLAGLNLTTLSVYDTAVTDLKPLDGMRLKNLRLDGTGISNIEVLRGMPLRRLQLDGCKRLTSLEPLAGCTNLECLTIPDHLADLSVLRRLPKLERLGAGPVPNGNWDSVGTPIEFWRTRSDQR